MIGLLVVCLSSVKLYPLTCRPSARTIGAMRDWSLTPGDPLHLTLAADARLCKPDYVNDHIWEVQFGASDPAAVSLHTTFGLRARSMRIFLRFTEGSSVITDPNTFIVKPSLRRFHPNF